MNRSTLVLAIFACLPLFGAAQSSFKTPPDSVKPWVYWYWIDDNISEKGITRDLEAMSALGIGEAFIGNIGLGGNPAGKVPVLSDEWGRLMKHAAHEAGRTGVHLGIFNSPGWSQSGGPWVKPGESMRYLTSTQITVTGPLHFHQQLPAPDSNFQDVALLAYPAPTGKTYDFPSDTALDLDTPLTVRSLVLYPGPHPFSAGVELWADGKLVKTFPIDRSNPALNVGPIPYAPAGIALPTVSARHFRLRFTHVQGQIGFTKRTLSPEPVVDDYMEKQLGKMFQTPHPMWDAYEWAGAPARAGLPLRKVIRLSAAGGVLDWNVPAGQWIILRVGMEPTGVKNSPAPPEATGPEIDKMSEVHLKAHFDAFIGKILREIPPEDRKAIHHVVEDSYEVGSENWTDEMAQDFRLRYGYDPLPWLPVLTGQVVNNTDQSDRFLWDLRRLIADRIAHQYVGGLRRLSEQHGLQSWLENYGHWGFPAEFLQYGGESNNVSGEFWAEGDLGSIELRDASSAAHIYGKNEVWAESFTAGGAAFQRYPALLKKRGDWSFTEGVNHTLLHVYIEQPFDSLPGMNAWFGTEFNRNNTWFPESKCWIDYLRRCNFLLQQGKPVSDVCYFIGEDAPKMTGIRVPALPRGYSYDYINGEVIRTRLGVKEGRLVLPDGLSYRILVLPPQRTMRPDLLKKIRDLVAAGAVILGDPPLRSPSLQDYPRCDEEVRQVSAALWGPCDGKRVKSIRYGKGLVLRGMSLEEAFRRLHVQPDFDLYSKDSILFAHRATAREDIYFVTNQGDSMAHIRPSFRATAGSPELWDPITGDTRALPEFYRAAGGTGAAMGTVVPLELRPGQSWFVVFRENGHRPTENGRPATHVNFPAPTPLLTLPGPWEVSFDSSRGGPVHPVHFDSLKSWSEVPVDSIRYFSGDAVYHTTFSLEQTPPKGRLIMDLGKVAVLAHVWVNGRDLGGVWTDPWQVDVTEAVGPGENRLEIKVVNLWVNRLIGDSRLPQAQRRTWTPNDPYTPTSPLTPSGLLGPVTVLSVRY